jgi:iron(II)-dependent oxidoreductase
MLLDARARTLALAAQFSGEQLLGPRLSIVNPPLWELGHLAWFQERWCLRRRRGSQALLPSVLPGADALYDSAAVAHDTRWDLPLPDFDATLDYLDTVITRVLERVESGDDRDLEYFAHLVAMHEDMHCEALTYTRQTHGYSAPRTPQSQRRFTRDASAHADAEISGGTFMLGATPGDGFVFDNEKWAHPVGVSSFSMARACVTQQEFAAFVDDRGYERRALWSDQGWAWRVAANASHPVYWRRDAGEWRVRRFDAWQALDSRAAMVHVNWYEANAYCAWAGRRLPTEAEWEYAAATQREPGSNKRRYPWGDSLPDETRANLHGVGGAPADVSAFAAGDSAWACRQMIGNVWEWTADSFGPYPGFVVDPYQEYSQPWFATHKVLRGGSFATGAVLIRNTWRNFYTPDRRDVYAGFRTCALSG